MNNITKLSDLQSLKKYMLLYAESLEQQLEIWKNDIKGKEKERLVIRLKETNFFIENINIWLGISEET